MTQLRLPALAAAAFLAASPLLHAQQLQDSHGTTLTPIVTAAPGHSILGIDLDAAGNIYYLDTDASATDADGNLNTRLFQRTPAGVTTELFNFGAHGFTNAPFGSFVRVNGNTIYWGENSTGTLWSATLGPGGSSLVSPTQIGQVDGNYDLAFNGAGEAYLSADPSFGQENHVYRLTLGSGAITLGSNSLSKVYESTDYSGPIAFDSAGNLLYGQAGFTSSGGLFRFNATELSGATELSLSGHLLLDDGPNAYLAFGSDDALYQNGSGLLNRIDYTGSLQSSVLASSPDGFLGPMATFDGEVYTIVSKGFGATTSAAIYALVPEPASVSFLLLGAGTLCVRRFRRP